MTSPRSEHDSNITLLTDDDIAKPHKDIIPSKPKFKEKALKKHNKVNAELEAKTIKGEDSETKTSSSLSSMTRKQKDIEEDAMFDEENKLFSKKNELAERRRKEDEELRIKEVLLIKKKRELEEKYSSDGGDTSRNSSRRSRSDREKKKINPVEKKETKEKVSKVRRRNKERKISPEVPGETKTVTLPVTEPKPNEEDTSPTTLEFANPEDQVLTQRGQER